MCVRGRLSAKWPVSGLLHRVQVLSRLIDEQRGSEQLGGSANSPSRPVPC